MAAPGCGRWSDPGRAGGVFRAEAAVMPKHSIEGDFNRVTVSDVENLIKNGGNGRVQR